MKIIISFPPLKGKGFPMVRQARQFQWVTYPSHIYPVIAASAATLLRNDGFEVIFNDCLAEGWSYEQFLGFVRKENPELMVFETKTPVIKLHWQIINELKYSNPDLKIALAGDHVTVFPEESLRESKVDFVIAGGDYDNVLLGLARYLKGSLDLPKGVWYRDGGCIKNSGDFQLIEDLNALPFIDRKLTKWQLYGEKWRKRKAFAYTMAGRDCPYGKCAFCSWVDFFPRFRIRSTGNLLDEIGLLIARDDAREVFDDTGTFPGGAWLDSFCEGMIRRGFGKKILFSCNMRFDYLNKKNVSLMKMAGFRKLKLGMESANQNTLDRLNKGVTVEQIINGCKIASRAGLEVHLTVMFGYPWETRQEVTRTFDVVKDLLHKGYIEMLQSTVLVPYPGTPLFYEGLNNGWFRFDHSEYERYDMKEPVFKTEDLSPSEVMQACNNAYKLFFAPKFILQKALNRRSFSQIPYLMRGARSMYGHVKDFARRYAKNA